MQIKFWVILLLITSLPVLISKDASTSNREVTGYQIQKTIESDKLEDFKQEEKNIKSEYSGIPEETTETKITTQVKTTTRTTKATETTHTTNTELMKNANDIQIPVTTESVINEYPKIEDVISKYQYSIYYDMDVTILSGFSQQEFQVLMDSIDQDDPNDFFSNNAQIILELCNEYEINELFFCGIIAQESWWGKADNCVANNNYTGMMGMYGLDYYSSVYENLEDTAINLHNNYLTPDGGCYNGCTIYGVAICYCDPSWADAIYSRMSEMF